MTAAVAERLELRAVGEDDFDEIYPLLLGFQNRRMEREHWRSMVFRYPWADGSPRGWALYAKDQAVGFIGTIFSSRRVLGRLERFCNASCWIVKPEYRSASVLLLKPLLALRECTLVNFTPTQRAYEIFAKLGFQPLEQQQLLLPPLGSVSSLLRGSVLTEPSAVRAELSAEQRILFDDLSPSERTSHVVLRCDGRTCYLIATVMRRKRVRFAELQYVSDRDFLWNHRALAHVAFLRTIGAAGIAIDARFAQGSQTPAAVRMPARRLYRPSNPDIIPSMVDGLYSELMTLQI